VRTVVALRMRVDECGSDVHHVGVTVVDISSRLEGSADAVWAAVKTPVAFRRVTRGLITMPVLRTRVDEWREGETVVGWVFLFGVIPFSRHHLHVSGINDTSRTLSSREKGGVVRRWDHDIIVTPVDDRSCIYRDRISIDAGVFTPFVAIYARCFYAVRQRRWRTLAKELSR